MNVHVQVEYAALDAYASGWAAARAHFLVTSAQVHTSIATSVSGVAPSALQQAPAGIATFADGVPPVVTVPPLLVEWLAAEAALQVAEERRRVAARAAKAAR